MGGGHWGCCCESSSSGESFTSSSTESGSISSYLGDCTCCANEAYPSEVEVTLTGLVNNPTLACSTCPSYNGTYILPRISGCFYELPIASNCGPCAAGSSNEFMQFAFIISNPSNPGTSICGVGVKLVMSPGDHITWTRASIQGRPIDCCNFNESNIRATSYASTCSGGIAQCHNPLIFVGNNPSRIAVRSLGC